MALAEHTKQARRNVILDAAERLIRGEAGTQFSMRAVAIEAGVSQATPFNLFGSKAKILEALFVRSISMPEGEQPGVFDLTKHNALDYSFSLCDSVMESYAEDAVYYRALLSGLSTSIDSLLVAIANWEVVVHAAVQQGDLRSDTPVSSVAETIEYGIVGSMAFWSTGDFASARLVPQARFAIASTLYMFANPRAQLRLKKIVKSAARTLRALGALGSNAASR